tara:strand:+ start:14659 stop:15039 length:381 start_codon:yes stop_codon:yes gene_type:complete
MDGQAIEIRRNERQAQRREELAREDEARRESQAREELRAQKDAAERAVFAEKAARFRIALRAGDQVIWFDQSRSIKGYGMAIRLEGDLVYVQFDNVSFGGTSSRFVRKSELFPPDGTKPSIFHEAR